MSMLNARDTAFFFPSTPVTLYKTARSSLLIFMDQDNAFVIAMEAESHEQ